MSKHELSDMKKWVAAGHLVPPGKSAAKVLDLRGDPQWRHVDAWLSWVYAELAEPLADVEHLDPNTSEQEGASPRAELLPDYRRFYRNVLFVLGRRARQSHHFQTSVGNVEAQASFSQAHATCQVHVVC